jgi:hypothetical protein
MVTIYRNVLNALMLQIVLKNYVFNQQLKRKFFQINLNEFRKYMCYNYIVAVRQIPPRHEHLKMAAWGRNMCEREREGTNIKQRCILTDIKKAKQLYAL